MAVIVLVTYWGVGLTRDFKGFVKHLLGPVLILSPLFLAIELMTMLIVRPASLSLRLSGNIFGDHMVFNIMSGLVPALLPVLFLLLAMLVAVIQAFVFSLLTTIYISQSLPHGDHDHAPEHH
jgi:F-type H+-transporting ATPase subunit a